MKHILFRDSTVCMCVCVCGVDELFLLFCCDTLLVEGHKHFQIT